MRQRLSATKLESIEKLADRNGIFKIVAIDHRDVYAAMYKENTDITPDFAQLVQSKREIVKELSKYASSFLLDPVYCTPELTLDGSIGECSFMVSIEGNDYNTKNFSENYLHKDTDLQKIKEMGASGVKLFLYYNPELPLSDKQDALIEKVSRQCSQFGIPFVLEPILYYEGSEPAHEQKVELTKTMLSRLSKFEIDVFKVIFPGDIQNFADKENIRICKYVTENLNRPWIILSSGIDQEAFLGQLAISCKSGASGFAIGRTLWSGCVGISKTDGPEKYDKMVSIFEKAASITTLHGMNWKDRYQT